MTAHEAQAGLHEAADGFGAGGLRGGLLSRPGVELGEGVRLKADADQRPGLLRATPFRVIMS